MPSDSTVQYPGRTKLSELLVLLWCYALVEMPTQQLSKVTELKDISERLVEAIVHQPKVDAKEVRKFLRKARHKDLDQLEKQVAILKSLLKKMGVPFQAARELDELRMDIDDRWAVALETIDGMLEER
jgi:hypothetical protein